MRVKLLITWNGGDTCHPPTIYTPTLFLPLTTSTIRDSVSWDTPAIWMLWGAEIKLFWEMKSLYRDTNYAKSERRMGEARIWVSNVSILSVLIPFNKWRTFDISSMPLYPCSLRSVRIWYWSRWTQTYLLKFHLLFYPVYCANSKFCSAPEDKLSTLEAPK